MYGLGNRSAHIKIDLCHRNSSSVSLDVYVFDFLLDVNIRTSDNYKYVLYALVKKPKFPAPPSPQKCQMLKCKDMYYRKKM